MRIRVGHLYPDYLNIYADRGNIAVLEPARGAARARARRAAVSVGDELVPGAHDLLYVGGGQDREQALVAPDLAAKGRAIEEAGGRRRALLAVCGGYQLLGRGYLGRDGVDMPGVGLFPHETVAGTRRMIGDVLLECELEPGQRRTLAGFENHARPHAPRSGREAARTRRGRLRQRRRVRLRGLPRRPRGRHVPARARSCRATPGSPTGCSRRRSRTPQAASRRSSSRYRTSSRRRRTRSQRSAPETAAAASRIAAAERSTSSRTSASSTTEIRIAAAPVPGRARQPARAVLLDAPDDLARGVSSSSPKRTSTWFSTTSFRTSTPVLRRRGGRRTCERRSQQRSTSSATPVRPSARMRPRPRSRAPGARTPALQSIARPGHVGVGLLEVAGADGHRGPVRLADGRRRRSPQSYGTFSHLWASVAHESARSTPATRWRSARRRGRPEPEGAVDVQPRAGGRGERRRSRRAGRWRRC